MITMITDSVLSGYLETALWSEFDWDGLEGDSGNPDPLDRSYDCDDFSDYAKQQAWNDCRQLVAILQNTPCSGDYDNLYDAADHLQGDGRIGHDFWLTRNGHGAGFWDGDYVDQETGIDYGDLITEIVRHNFKGLDIYPDCDGRLHFE